MELVKVKVALAIFLSFVLVSICVYQYTKELTPVELALRGIPAVVVITSPEYIRVKHKKPKLVGYAMTAGFVATRYGHIVTTAHGISNKVVEIRFHGHSKPYHAVLLASSILLDIAILQVPNMPDDIPWLSVNDSGHYIPGTPLTIIGHPRGVDWSVSSGIVSNDVVNDDHILELQITAIVASGNSGGPVLDSQGSVMGVVTSYALGSRLGYATHGASIKAMLRGVYSDLN